LKQTGLTSAACLLARPSLAAEEPAATPLKRIGIKEFAQDARALADFRRAVQKMRDLPPRHPFSWIFQANMHWRPFYPDYVYQQADESDDPGKQLFRDATGFSPVDDVFNKCPHGNWWFLPWHRAYLYFFERILRWACGNDKLTLPYWNYSDDTQRLLPQVFRDRTTDGKRDGPPNPLYLPSSVTFEDARGNPQVFPMRDGPLNDGLSQLTPYVTSTRALLIPSFTTSSPATPQEGFGSPRACDAACACGSGALESIPHNQVHRAIGGNAVQVGDARRVGFMGDVSTAARDPIFWLHHSNIDRLWASWNALKDHTNPQEADWLDYEFTFYDVGEKGKEKRGPVPVVVTPRQLLHTRDLGYEYDRLESPPAGSSPPVVLVPGRSIRLLAETSAPAMAKIGKPHRMDANPIRLGETKAKEVALPLPETLKARQFRDALGEKSEEAGVLHLSVEGIQFQDPPGVYYDVYLGLPKDTAPTPESPYYLGTITFFGMAHGHETGHASGGHARRRAFTVSFRVPPRLQQKLQETDPTRLSVTFVPQTGTEPVDKKAKPKEREEKGEGVTVRRVQLVLVR
jgi:tyrosinase